MVVVVVIVIVMVLLAVIKNDSSRRPVAIAFSVVSDWEIAPYNDTASAVTNS